MTNYIVRIILVITLFSPALVFSQTHDHSKCGTDFYQQEYFDNNPGAYEDYIQHLNSRDVRPFKAQRRANLRIIPVVVHIIHQGGAENISDEKVHTLLDKLNEDYQGKNADSSDIREIFEMYFKANPYYLYYPNLLIDVYEISTKTPKSESYELPPKGHQVASNCQSGS